MSLPKNVTIVEVGPRDGLQSEPKIIDSNIKIDLINLLATTGIKIIEAGSFVSPEWVPQMANTAKVLSAINRHSDISYPVLVPNLQGLERAIEAKVDTVAIFAAASETFSQKNINCSIAESLKRFEPVITKAKAANIKVRGYVSCVLGCPYEGVIKLDAVKNVSSSLFDMGCYEISLGDTIGVGTPNKVVALLETLSSKIPLNHLAAHFHDTYGQAIANIYAALQCGINIIDSAIAGLGGCPYAEGASGNVATEDVLYLLEGLNINTGINLEKVVTISDYITKILNRPNHSRVAKALLAKNQKLKFEQIYP